MSASSDQGLISTCLAAGATECLVKPVTKKEVQQMWQHVWRRQQRSTSTSLLQGHLASGHLQGHLLVSGSDMEQMKHAAPFAHLHDMVRRQPACSRLSNTAGALQYFKVKELQGTHCPWLGVYWH